MIPVAICSPIPALRAGLRALIAADPALNPAAMYASLAEMLNGDDGDGSALETVYIVTADALGEAGLHALVERPDLTVLLVCDAEEFAELAGAEAFAGGEARAWGVVSPETSAEGLQAAVHALAEGLILVSPDLMQAVLNFQGMGVQTALSGEAASPVLEDGEHLTNRETDVLLLVAQGLTNKQIALALRISEHTVKFHVSSIYAKLNVSNRTEAVRKGARQGIIPL